MSQGFFRSVIFRAHTRDPPASLCISTFGYFLLKASDICFKGMEREPALKMISFSWVSASAGEGQKSQADENRQNHRYAFS